MYLLVFPCTGICSETKCQHGPGEYLAHNYFKLGKVSPEDTARIPKIGNLQSTASTLRPGPRLVYEQGACKQMGQIQEAENP